VEPFFPISCPENRRANRRAKLTTRLCYGTDRRSSGPNSRNSGEPTTPEPKTHKRGKKKGKKAHQRQRKVKPLTAWKGGPQALKGGPHDGVTSKGGETPRKNARKVRRKGAQNGPEIRSWMVATNSLKELFDKLHPLCS